MSRRLPSQANAGKVSEEAFPEKTKPQVSLGFDDSCSEWSSDVVRVGDRARTGDILIHSSLV